ncbi:MAG: hypothetical protein IGR93_00945 [Hydrococcus sp. C42_A2020_068]|nr:hypothetical protein [Hydrococcus sp. C42_A2020_068]
MKPSSSPLRFSPSTETVIAAGIFWSLLTLYCAVAFGMPLPGQEVPRWYALLGYIFDGVAYLGAALLCLRNWLCPRLLSDRRIWLYFSLRSWLYLLANFFFGYWELGLERFPDVSVADPFYILSYIALLWGMVLAVRSKQVSLKPWQYAAIAGLVALGIWLGWLSSFPPQESQTTLASSVPILEPAIVAQSAAEKEAPKWVLAVEKSLAPLAGVLSLLYVVSDVFLLVLAGTLVLTFWGGRFSRTWAVIATSALLLYAADIRYAYVISRGNFETGGLLDTLWVFSGILLGIGAALEYDISTRPRQRRR